MNDTNTDMNIELSEEQIAKIKAAAQKRAEEAKEKAEDANVSADPNDLGEAIEKAPEDSAGPEKQRKVALEKHVTIDVYKDDEVVNTLKPDRNIIECLLVLKTLDPETVISIYATEDEKISDPLKEGEERPKYPLFDITKKTVKDAVQVLASQGIPDQGCVIEFQKLCEFMSFRSTLAAANVVFVFKGGRAGGFSYFSSCTDVSDDDAIAVYNAAKEQNKQYKAKLKELRPQVKFDDDTNIITHL